jgi:hypothetical protein
MSNRNDLDRRVLAALQPNEKIRALLRERGLEYQDIAGKYGFWGEQVSQCARGARKYPQIRDVFAQELGLTREQIDELIDGPGKAMAADEGGGVARARVAVPA